MSSKTAQAHIAAVAFISGGFLYFFPNAPFYVLFIISGILYAFIVIIIKSKLKERKRRTFETGSFNAKQQKEFIELLHEVLDNLRILVSMLNHIFEAQNSNEHFTNKEHYSKSSYKNNYERNSKSSGYRSYQNDHQHHRARHQDYRHYQHYQHRQENQQSNFNNIKSVFEAAKILGVNLNANAEEIQKAFAKLLMAYHPDLHATKPLDEQEKYSLKTKQIIEAREILFKFYSSNQKQKQCFEHY